MSRYNTTLASSCLLLLMAQPSSQYVLNDSALSQLKCCQMFTVVLLKILPQGSNGICATLPHWVILSRGRFINLQGQIPYLWLVSFSQKRNAICGTNRIQFIHPVLHGTRKTLLPFTFCGWLSSVWLPCFSFSLSLCLSFSLRAFEDESKARLGVVECAKHELLQPFTVLHEKEGELHWLGFGLSPTDQHHEGPKVIVCTEALCAERTQ